MNSHTSSHKSKIACWITAACVWLLITCSILAQEPSRPLVLTNIHDVLALGNDSKRHSNVMAQLRGVVTFALYNRTSMFIQEGATNGVFVVYRGAVTNYPAGTLVEARGPIASGPLAPYVKLAQVTVVGQAPLPKALEANPEGMIDGSFYGRFVVVRGVVRDMITSWGNLTLSLGDATRTHQVQVRVGKDFRLPRHWIDAEMEVRGLCWTATDSRGRAYGFTIYAADTNLLSIQKLGPTNAYDRPLQRLSMIAATKTNTSVRARVQGVVTHYSSVGQLYIEADGVPAQVLVMNPIYQGDREGEFIDRPKLPMMKAGDRIELVGAVSTTTGPITVFRDAEYRRIGEGVAPVPRMVNVQELMAGQHYGRVVRLRARLLERETMRFGVTPVERLILQADDQVFTGVLENPESAELPFRKNEYVEMTGLATTQSGRWNRIHSFSLLARDPSDIREASPPAFFKRREVMRTLAITGVLALLAGTWIFWQRRQMVRLRASEERFRALIENSFDVTFVLNADGTAKYASPSAARLLGRPHQAEGVLPFSISEIVHPDDLPIIVAAHQEVLITPGKSKRVERYRLVTGDGSIRYAEAIGTNCLHVPGVKGVVVNVRDVTERELAHQELERSELAQRRINEFATSLSPLHSEEDIVWEITRRCISVLGFEDCVIYLLDDARGVLVQKAAYGPKNPHEREIVAPIEIIPGKGIVGSVAVSGRPEVVADTTMDARYIVDDAARLSEITVPIVVEGRVIGVIDSEHSQRGFFTQEHLAVLSSIASLAANKLVRARAEEQLQRLNEDLELRVKARTAELGDINNRLRAEVGAREVAESELRVALAAERELNQLKSSFVSMISHEIRTPLEVILSSSNILDRYLERLPPEKRKAQLRAIRKSVHRMNDLVEDVLLLGKFDAGRLLCTPGLVDLAGVCRRVAAEVETASGREGAIEIRADDFDDEASADETLLVHILGNLLGNALKYSGTSEQVDFTITRHGPDAEFVVTDRGCGIPVADQSRLFTPFYRGANVGHTRGTGLGLAIVKRCVELHDGAIRCESAVGYGTTFTVTLPLFDGTRRFRRKPSTESHLS